MPSLSPLSPLGNMYFVYSSLANTAPEFDFQFVSFLSSMNYNNNRSCIFGDIIDTLCKRFFPWGIYIKEVWRYEYKEFDQVLRTGRR